jgi:hypothetical protein
MDGKLSRPRAYWGPAEVTGVLGTPGGVPKVVLSRIRVLYRGRVLSQIQVELARLNRTDDVTVAR